MKKNKIRIQQSVMTILSILFLVWVGYFGMTDEQINEGGVEGKQADKVVNSENEVIAESNDVTIAENELEVTSGTTPTIKLTSKYHTYAKEYDVKVKLIESKIEKIGKQGRVVAVFVKEGQLVNSGQPIIAFESENSGVLSESELKKELRKFETLKSKLESAQVKVNKAESKDSASQAKQQSKYEDILKEYKILESKINSGQNKYERIVIRAGRGGIVKNLNLKMGDDVIANTTIFKVVSYDVFFDLTNSDLELWKQAQDQVTITGAFIGKDGQSIPFDIQANGIQERMFIKQYIPIWENLKFFTDDTVDNKVSLVAVYKDIIEVPNTAVAYNSEGKAFVWIVDVDKRISKKYVTLIKKYGSNIVLADTALNGKNIVLTVVQDLVEGKEINY